VPVQELAGQGQTTGSDEKRRKSDLQHATVDDSHQESRRRRSDEGLVVIEA
jgi:hypothetical protein